MRGTSRQNLAANSSNSSRFRPGNRRLYRIGIQDAESFRHQQIRSSSLFSTTIQSVMILFSSRHLLPFASLVLLCSLPGCGTNEPLNERERAEQAQEKLEEVREGAAEKLAEAQEEAAEVVSEAEAEAVQIMSEAKQEATTEIREAERDLQERINQLAEPPEASPVEPANTAEPSAETEQPVTTETPVTPDSPVDETTEIEVEVQPDEGA